MTREEIINAGVSPAIARAVSTYLRGLMSFGATLGDATTLINSEGQARGFLRAADAIAALAEPLTDQKQTQLPLYSPPTDK